MGKIRAVAILAALSAFAIGCGSTTPKKVSSSTSGSSDSTAGEAVNEVKEETPEGKAVITVEETGFTAYADYDDTQRGTAGAVIKNSGTEPAAFFDVVFTFRDAAGKPVGTQSTYVYAIDAGGTAYAAVGSVSLQGEPATIEATAVYDDDKDSFITFKGTTLPVTVTSVTPGQYGGTEIAGTVSNPSADVVENGSITCILRSGGAIVAGTDTYSATLVPGGDGAWETHFTSDIPIDAAECGGGIYS